MIQKPIGILILIFVLICLSSNQSLAAPAQRQDSTRQLYDRVMEEFKHRDYEAAMAGFRLFIECPILDRRMSVSHKAISRCPEVVR
jgi:hypothetical protein